MPNPFKQLSKYMELWIQNSMRVSIYVWFLEGAHVIWKLSTAGAKWNCLSKRALADELTLPANWTSIEQQTNKQKTDWMNEWMRK